MRIFIRAVNFLERFEQVTSSQPSPVTAINVEMPTVALGVSSAVECTGVFQWILFL